MTLLICDDEIIPTQAMYEAIDWQDCGIQSVLLAHSVREAKQMIQEQSVDLCLCDIEMPGESGVELLRWINRNYSNIIFAFLTCHAEFSYAQEAVRLGSFDYLLKPVQYSDVIALINRMVETLQGHRSAERVRQYGERWINEKKQEYQPTSQKPGEIVKNVNRFIQKNISEDITIEKLASNVYLCPDYLGRLYKKQTAITLNRYIIQERMTLAGQLLKDNAMTVTAVASAVGYISYPSFVNMFKRVFGVTPSAYQEAYTKK